MSKGLSSKIEYLSRSFQSNIAYIDICGDHLAGVLLSRIKYWYMPSKKNGATKLRVKKEGRLWLVKKRDDWYEEIRITPKQYDRAIKILEKLNLVELKKFRFNGSPTIHIGLNEELLDQLLENEYQKFIQNNIENDIGDDRGEIGTLPLGKIEIDEKGKTLTSTTTSTINNINNTVTTVPVPSSSKKKKEPNKQYADNVKMKESQYETLCNDYGKDTVDRLIREVNEYVVKRGKPYANSVQAIHTFAKRQNIGRGEVVTPKPITLVNTKTTVTESTTPETINLDDHLEQLQRELEEMEKQKEQGEKGW